MQVEIYMPSYSHDLHARKDRDATKTQACCRKETREATPKTGGLGPWVWLTLYPEQPLAPRVEEIVTS